MITNERQYKISKTQLEHFREAVETFDLKEVGGRVGPALAMVELEALKSERDVLCDQIREYDALKSGAVRILKATALDEMPSMLIRARIAKGLSQREFAKILGVKEQQIQRYEAEKYASASLKRLVQIAEALDLNISEIAEIKQQAPVKSSAESLDIDWELFPVREMYIRGWFKDVDFSGSLAAAMSNGVRLAEKYVQKAMPRRQPAFLRQRAKFGVEMDHYALWAWQSRILLLAQSTSLAGNYDLKSITKEWLTDLVRQSRFEDGPVRAKQMLSEVGVSLVIEPHLPKTYLDGAVFLLPSGAPVIGLTLRYDRLDNFWFVLLHELAHMVKHLRKGALEDIFDDLDAEPDSLEREADAFASAILVPEGDWEIALARYTRSQDDVQSFAQDHGIHPSIVAGRIRKEADNYMILSDLVGAGKVRAQFPEVRFG